MVAVEERDMQAVGAWGHNARLDVERIRADFPALEQQVYGRPLVYLDNAATAQKPRSVIEAVCGHYRRDAANVHRAVHALSSRATLAYEEARDRVCRFLNAPARETIVFTRGATEGINLVAYGWGRHHLREGDEILLTEMEHHSNLVPWQLLAQATGAQLRFLRVRRDGTLTLDELDTLLTERTKLVAFTHVSNVLGTINPAATIIDAAHRVGAITLLDAAQSVPHMPVDVQALDVDLLVFSGHKLGGPTSSGALYGKREILESMEPFLAGGDMISSVWLDHAAWNEVPWQFEAGTPAIAEQIGLGAAVEYLTSVGMEAIHAHEQRLTAYALAQLQAIPAVEIYGEAPARAGVISFLVAGIHPHDLAQLLDQEGIAVRAGNHCAQPLHRVLDQVATCRASFYLDTTEAEVDALVAGIRRAQRFFGVE